MDYPVDNTHIRSDLLRFRVRHAFRKFAWPEKMTCDNAKWLNDGCLTYLLLKPGGGSHTTGGQI